jgi:hypothetical protein
VEVCPLTFVARYSEAHIPIPYGPLATARPPRTSQLANTSEIHPPIPYTNFRTIDPAAGRPTTCNTIGNTSKVHIPIPFTTAEEFPRTISPAPGRPTTHIATNQHFGNLPTDPVHNLPNNQPSGTTGNDATNTSETYPPIPYTNFRTISRALPPPTTPPTHRKPTHRSRTQTSEQSHGMTPGKRASFTRLTMEVGLWRR